MAKFFNFFYKTALNIFYIPFGLALAGIYIAFNLGFGSIIFSYYDPNYLPVIIAKKLIGQDWFYLLQILTPACILTVLIIAAFKHRLEKTIYKTINNAVTALIFIPTVIIFSGLNFLRFLEGYVPMKIITDLENITNIFNRFMPENIAWGFTLFFIMLAYNFIFWLIHFIFTKKITENNDPNRPLFTGMDIYYFASFIFLILIVQFLENKLEIAWIKNTIDALIALITAFTLWQIFKKIIVKISGYLTR